MEAPTTVKMQRLQKILSSLLTKTNSDSQFQEPANQKEMENELKELGELAHHLSQGIPFSNSDPIYTFLPSHIEDEVSGAYPAFRSGNRAYARYSIHAITGLCIACHTMEGSGAALVETTSPVNLPLKPLELAQFYVASRQFELAEGIYSQILQGAGTGTEDLDEAIRQSLAIAVRVKDDPKLALDFVEKILRSPQVPEFIKLNAIEWRKSVQSWMAAKRVASENPDAMFRESEKLIESAQKQQKYFMDRSADIQFLRASALLHRLLKKPLPNHLMSEAYYLEGVCYDVLNSFYFDSLNNFYFESCIKNWPASKIAEKCYRRLEQNIYFGYTGSSGTHIPEAMRIKLNDLKAMAFRKAQVFQ